MISTPIVVALICLLVYLLGLGLLGSFYQYNMSALLFIGEKRFERDAERPLPPRQVFPAGMIVHKGTTGYEGADYYLVARDPLMLDKEFAPKYKRNNLQIYGRILYPLLSWGIDKIVLRGRERLPASAEKILVLLGLEKKASAQDADLQDVPPPAPATSSAAEVKSAEKSRKKVYWVQPDYLPLIMLSINILSIFIGCYFLSRFLKKKEVNPLLALIFWFSGGIIFGVFLDTAIPFALLLLLLGIISHDAEHPGIAFVFFALSMLTHETMALPVGALVLASLFTGKGKRFLLYLLSALPSFLWRIWAGFIATKAIIFAGIPGVLRVARPDLNIWVKVQELIASVPSGTMDAFRATGFLMFFIFLALAFLWSIACLLRRGGVYPFLLFCICAYLICTPASWWDSYVRGMLSSGVVFLPLVLSYKKEGGLFGKFLASLTLLISLVVAGRIIMLLSSGWGYLF